MSSSLNIYIVTLNCGKSQVDVQALSAHLFKPYHNLALKDWPDLVVLKVQEIAPFGYAFLGGTFLTPYWDRIHACVDRVSSPVKYRHVATYNAGTTGITSFAKAEIAGNIARIEKAGVGVGPWELGNKGAAGLRLTYLAHDSREEMALTFVAAHLSAGEGKTDLRNKNWESIVRGLAFPPIKPVRPTRAFEQTIKDDESESESLLTGSKNSTNAESGMFTTHSILFFGGDLNYRTSDVGPGRHAHKLFPQPTTDLANEKHYSHLLRHDQLAREKDAGKTLHNLSESPISFPPTYKYALESYQQLPPQSQLGEGEPATWHWASHRFPSWCDRIFFPTYLSQSPSALEVITYEALPIQPTTDHRPVALAVRVSLSDASSAAQKLQSNMAPFSLNPHARSMRAAGRRHEIILGILAYLGWTWEGNGLVLASIIGAIGGWFVLKSLLSS